MDSVLLPHPPEHYLTPVSLLHSKSQLLVCSASHTSCHVDKRHERPYGHLNVNCTDVSFGLFDHWARTDIMLILYIWPLYLSDVKL